MKENVLKVNNLSVNFQTTKNDRELLNNISFEVPAGEIVSIIGESGSGKSLTAKAMLDLLPNNMTVSSGTIQFAQQNVLEMNKKEKRQYRRKKIGFVFQDMFGTFDPLRTIGQHFKELYSADPSISKNEAYERAIGLLYNMQLVNPERVYESHPYELSGGMRQRVQLALALSMNPDLLIADEPTTALDTRIQADVLYLIKQWSKRTGGSVLFITHDLGVVAELAHSVIVMKDGRIVESAPVMQLFNEPKHEHTKQLLSHYKKLTNVYDQRSDLPNDPLLSVKSVSKTYSTKKWFRKQSVTAVSDANFCIHKGEIVGLIGESGSGKSTLSRLLLHLESSERGDIVWHGQFPFRKRVQWVHQDPLSSFDPRWNVEKIVGEGLDYWKDESINRQEKIKEVLKRLD